MSYGHCFVYSLSQYYFMRAFVQTYCCCWKRMPEPPDDDGLTLDERVRIHEAARAAGFSGVPGGRRRRSLIAALDRINRRASLERERSRRRREQRRRDRDKKGPAQRTVFGGKRRSPFSGKMRITCTRSDMDHIQEGTTISETPEQAQRRWKNEDLL